MKFFNLTQKANGDLTTSCDSSCDSVNKDELKGFSGKCCAQNGEQTLARSFFQGLQPFHSLLFILFLSGLYALRCDIEVYISNMWLGQLCEYVFKACITNNWFNFLFTLTLAYAFVVQGVKVYNSKGCVLRSISCGFAVVYLFTNSHWVFPKLFFIDADYGTFLIVSLIAILILDVIALVRRCFSPANTPDDSKGYCMDGVYSELKETGWDNYVSELLALMPQERLKKESLAIGISGSWGSGKTSFLKSMQKGMKKDYYRVISFNPWTCTDKTQIISQFFALMCAQIKDENKPLQKAIQKYCDIVLDNDVHPFLTFLAKVLLSSPKEETLESLKNKIEEGLTVDKSKPFAIFIDDLDRLEGEELFEVLRLIRITANFRNVVFVVAYDRDYICNALNESKSIKRADEYIQKIFHLEVSLPKYEDDILLDVFMEEVVRIASLNEDTSIQLKRSIMQLLKGADLSFTDFIPNFRQARRFANVFSVNLRSFLAHTKNFVTKDFVGIELLHFAFPDVYRILMRKPTILLKQSSETCSKLTLLVYESEKNTASDKLLKRLFSDYNITKATSREIRSLLSYANYFCYRLPKNAIGVLEFEMLMIENELDAVRKGVSIMIQNESSVDSLYEHFRSYDMHGYKDTKVIRNYICALLEFLPKLTENDIKRIMSERYWVREGVDVNELQNQQISLFEYSINNGVSLANINYLLANYYIPYPVDYYPEEIALGLLNEDQLVKLAGKSLAKYIEINGKPSISEISDKGSSFNTFLKSGCYIQSYYSEGDEDVANYNNLMRCELLRQYQGTEANSATFNEFIQPYLIKTDDPAEEEFEAEGIANDIRSIFGDYGFFENFVHVTFCRNEEIEKKLKFIRQVMSL